MSAVCRKPATDMVSDVLISSFSRWSRVGLVADEDDLLDAGLVAFVDLEHEVDAVVRKLDDLRLDADVEAAVAPVDLDDALHVGLHGRARQRAARLRLHFVGELVVLELLVAFERDPVDDRVFDHRDDQPAAGLADAHVLEQAGGVERLERLVDLGSCRGARRGRCGNRSGWFRPRPAGCLRRRSSCRLARPHSRPSRQTPTAAPKTIPPRTMPTRPRPRSCRTHKFMRNAPFSTLFTDRPALPRDVLSTMFLQAFSHSATQRNAALPAFPAGNRSNGATHEAHSRGSS